MDLEQLQGAWRISALVVNGESAGGGATITIDGDRFTTAQMGAQYSGRIELNTAVSPKRLSLHFETGPEAGRTNHGIYELDSAEWRICLNIFGRSAPAEFASTPGSGLALETLVRARVPAVIAALREPVQELQGDWAMVSCVRAGEALPASFVKQGKRTIAGHQATLYFGPQLFMQGTLSQDGPGQIRLEFTSGEAPQLGIYEHTGNVTVHSPFIRVVKAGGGLPGAGARTRRGTPACCGFA